VSEEKFSKCEEGGKLFKYRISGVRKKKGSGRKKNFEKRFLGGNFAKFVFTGWVFMLICRFRLQRKKMKDFFSKYFSGGVCALHTLGRHVVKHG